MIIQLIRNEIIIILDYQIKWNKRRKSKYKFNKNISMNKFNGILLKKKLKFPMKFQLEDHPKAYCEFSLKDLSWALRWIFLKIHE